MCETTWSFGVLSAADICVVVATNQEINKSTATQFIVLFRDAGMQYRALYVYNPDDEVANEVVVTKIHGTGPKQLSSKSMERFYKYVEFCIGTLLSS